MSLVSILQVRVHGCTAGIRPVAPCTITRIFQCSDGHRSIVRRHSHLVIWASLSVGIALVFVDMSDPQPRGSSREVLTLSGGLQIVCPFRKLGIVQGPLHWTVVRSFCFTHRRPRSDILSIHRLIPSSVTRIRCLGDIMRFSTAS